MTATTSARSCSRPSRGKSWKVAELRSDTRTLEAVFRELAESPDASPIPRASIAHSKSDSQEVRA